MFHTARSNSTLSQSKPVWGRFNKARPRRSSCSGFAVARASREQRPGPPAVEMLATDGSFIRARSPTMPGQRPPSRRCKRVARRFAGVVLIYGHSNSGTGTKACCRIGFSSYERREDSPRHPRQSRNFCFKRCFSNSCNTASAFLMLAFLMKAAWPILSSACFLAASSFSPSSRLTASTSCLKLPPRSFDFAFELAPHCAPRRPVTAFFGQ
jgi:hypothetical protein